MRLIASPDLTAEDIAIMSSTPSESDTRWQVCIEREIDRILDTLEWRTAAEVLATLLRLGILQVRFAVPTAGGGIYHEKLGVFEDATGNVVSFKGSSNESWSAWHTGGNVESFEVFTSWNDGVDARRASRHRSYLEELWQGREGAVRIITLSDAAREKLLRVSHPSLEALGAPGTLHADTGHRVSRRTPLPHQLDTVASWMANGYRGIVQHATGSGKTFTALLCLKKHLEAASLALVVVPSVALLLQWREELSAEFPGMPVLQVGGGSGSWRQADLLMRFISTTNDATPRVVLTTMASAASSAFLRDVSSRPDAALIVDEVHGLGSTRHRELLTIPFARVLGLSATPERQGDADGTDALRRYFGATLEPVVTLADGIAAGRLVPYKYFPHVIDLDPDEQASYNELSVALRRELARATPHGASLPTITQRAQLLMIRRARVIKLARAKIALARGVLGDEYVAGSRWLVYCEDLRQLWQVKQALAADGLQPLEYHSKMAGERRETLSWLADFGGVVLSVRCLDEGVDIPAVDHALILASSQNERQFIQRRGRLLRKADYKPFATIHDALVLPQQSEEDDHTSYSVAEIKRALHFAHESMTPSGVVALRQVVMERGLQGAFDILTTSSHSESMR